MDGLESVGETLGWLAATHVVADLGPQPRTKIAAAAGVDVRTSPIHGRGLFSTRSVEPGDVLMTQFMQKQNSKGDPRARWEQSEECRHTNHADKPNAIIRKLGETVELVAEDAIQPNEEITLNYYDVTSTLGKGFFYTYRGKPYGNEPEDSSFLEKSAQSERFLTVYGLKTIQKQAQTTEDILRRIVNARKNTDTDVSEGAARAGNFRKGRFNYHGLKISIENPKGSIRSGVSASGKRWSTKMKHDYGYIRGTMGADGDPVDVFIGEDPKSEMVFVVNQVDKGGKFDEHKVVLGTLDAKQARKTYLDNYSAGWTGCGSVISMTMPQFRQWLTSDGVKKPAEEVKTAAVSPMAPWQTALGGAVLGGSLGGLADYLGGKDDKAWDGVLAGAAAGGAGGYFGNSVINATGQGLGLVEKKPEQWPGVIRPETERGSKQESQEFRKYQKGYAAGVFNEPKDRPHAPHGVSLEDTLHPTYNQEAPELAMKYRKRNPEIEYAQQIDKDVLRRRVPVIAADTEHPPDWSIFDRYADELDAVIAPPGSSLRELRPSLAGATQRVNPRDRRGPTQWQHLSAPHVFGERALAEAKRLYWEATGEHVTNPEEARTAWQYLLSQPASKFGPSAEGWLQELQDADKTHPDRAAAMEELYRRMPGLVRNKPAILPAGVKTAAGVVGVKAANRFAGVMKALQPAIKSTAQKVVQPAGKAVRQLATKAVLPKVRPNPQLVSANTGKQMLAKPQPTSVQQVVKGTGQHPSVNPLRPNTSPAVMPGKQQIRTVRDRVANVPAGEAFSQRPVMNTARLLTLDGVPGMRLVNQAAAGAAVYGAGNMLYSANNDINQALGEVASAAGDGIQATPEQQQGLTEDLLTMKRRLLWDQTVGAARRAAAGAIGMQASERAATQDQILRGLAADMFRKQVHTPAEKQPFLQKLIKLRNPAAAVSAGTPTLLQQVVGKPDIKRTLQQTLQGVKQMGVDAENPTEAEQIVLQSLADMRERLTQQQLDKVKDDALLGVGGVAGAVAAKQL